jgi:hypothetical protein
VQKIKRLKFSTQTDGQVEKYVCLALGTEREILIFEHLDR